MERCLPRRPWRSGEIRWMELPKLPMSSPSPPQVLGKRPWAPVMMELLTTTSILGEVTSEAKRRRCGAEIPLATER